MKRLLYVLLISNIAVLGILFGINHEASALTYSESVNVRFNINPTLSVNLSAADLYINNLVPGTVDDSNIITVSVTSNSASGYVLSANVGNDTTYDTRNLIKTDSADSFASIAFGSSQASLTADNTWGFSYKPSGEGTSWTNYSGLPLYSDTTNTATLISTTDPADSKSVQFKIGAKAASTMSSGTYNNVINFIVVANANSEQITCNPDGVDISEIVCMQDFNGGNAADITSSMEANTQYQLYDSRDNKQYYIAKFGNGRVWMTQNLDLDLSTSTIYTPSDTDIDNYWTPSVGTRSSDDSGWLVGNYDTPQSYDPGDLCWDGYIDDTGTGVSELETCTDRHYHIGNYYSWPAAAALNDSDAASYTQDTFVDQSICPAGWTLLRGDRGYYDDGAFYSLVGDSMAGPGSSGNMHLYPFYLVYGGSYYGVIRNLGMIGSYWLSTVYDYVLADAFAFDYLYSAQDEEYDRDFGASIRCIVRDDL